MEVRYKFLYEELDKRNLELKIQQKRTGEWQHFWEKKGGAWREPQDKGNLACSGHKNNRKRKNKSCGERITGQGKLCRDGPDHVRGLRPSVGRGNFGGLNG